MKKMMAITAWLLLVASSAFAANDLQAGAKAFSIGFGDSALNNLASPADASQTPPPVNIGGRYFIERDVAILAGFGFQTNGSDLSGTYFSIMFGARKYLRTEDFAPFLGVQFSYLSYDATVKINGANTKYADFTAYELAGMFGAEYFFAKQFSVEGSIGLGLGRMSSDFVNGQRAQGDTTYLGTKNLGVKANFYF